jgi:hypothetical protein
VGRRREDDECIAHSEKKEGKDGGREGRMEGRKEGRKEEVSTQSTSTPFLFLTSPSLFSLFSSLLFLLPSRYISPFSPSLSILFLLSSLSSPCLSLPLSSPSPPPPGSALTFQPLTQTTDRLCTHQLAGYTGTFSVNK